MTTLLATGSVYLVGIANTLLQPQDVTSLIGSGTITNRAFIWDDDFETDPDAWANFAYILQKHREGVIDLKGVIVCSKFDTSPPAVRAVLDKYALTGIPVGWKQRSGQSNPDFYNTKTRDKFGTPGETGAASKYKAAGLLYRELLVANPGVYIATGGFMDPLVDLMNSAADSISTMTGAQLIASAAPKLFVGLAMRPNGNQSSTTGWTGGINENNEALSLAAAVSFTNSFPGNITFYSFPGLSDFPSLHLPNHVKNTNDMDVDPLRYAFVQGCISTGTGDFGAVGPLGTTTNPATTERIAGDIVQFQVAVDDLLGTPTANFRISSGGVLALNATTGVSAFTMGGHARHKYATLTTAPQTIHDYWQSEIDALVPPTGGSTSAYESLVLASAPISFFRLNEGPTATSFVDKISSSRLLTRNGSMTDAHAGDATFTDSAGKSVTLNRTAAASLQGNTAVNTLTNFSRTTPFSGHCFFQHNVGTGGLPVSAQQSLFGKLRAATPYLGWEFNIQQITADVWRLSWDLSGDPNGIIVVTETQVNLAPNLAHHVGFTYDGSGSATGLKLFVNGVEMTTRTVASNNLTGTAQGDGNFVVGDRGPIAAAPSSLSGRIAEVVMYDKVITPAQMAAFSAARA
jgi:hypothetical protein